MPFLLIETLFREYERGLLARLGARQRELAIRVAISKVKSTNSQGNWRQKSFLTTSYEVNGSNFQTQVLVEESRVAYQRGLRARLGARKRELELAILRPCVSVRVCGCVSVRVCKCVSV